ncbi:hypothetical protein DSO57_1008563 [Entomophthora muscae]|uniref:Uncharacterized protein n=1 Tax=Entomophthora muscae TaxID=34485 RepID=A0ACC2UU53_9FUNG|nr:hypothetical protein DSO57_1008563 [Entomophthora muscae]
MRFLVALLALAAGNLGFVTRPALTQTHNSPLGFLDQLLGSSQIFPDDLELDHQLKQVEASLANLNKLVEELDKI